MSNIIEKYVLLMKKEYFIENAKNPSIILICRSLPSPNKIFDFKHHKLSCVVTV